MEALLVSLAVVAIGEIGDKTQLLAFILAARFRKPGPIILGILAATLANHGLAGMLGAWIRSTITPDMLRWGLGGAFIAVGLWALKPDDMDDDEPAAIGHYGVFLVTLASFFLAEMGDKTQVATVMLAARFDSLPAVVAGTTLGMLLADVPAVFFGKSASNRIPFHWVRYTAAALFGLIGALTLSGVPVF